MSTSSNELQKRGEDGMGRQQRERRWWRTDRVREFCVRRLCVRRFILCI